MRSEHRFFKQHQICGAAVCGVNVIRDCIAMQFEWNLNLVLNCLLGAEKLEIIVNSSEGVKSEPGCL